MYVPFVFNRLTNPVSVHAKQLIYDTQFYQEFFVKIYQVYACDR